MSDYTVVFSVGKRRCQLTATVRTTAPMTPLSSMVVSWSPDTPSGPFSALEQAQYVNGVTNFLASLSNQLIPLSIAVPF